MTHLVWTENGRVHFYRTDERLPLPDTGSAYADVVWRLMRDLVTPGAVAAAIKNATLRTAMATEAGLPALVASAPPRYRQLLTSDTKITLRVRNGVCYVDLLDVEAGASIALPPLSASFSPFTWAAIRRFMRVRNPALTTAAQQEAAIFNALVNNVGAITQVVDRR